MHSPVRRKALPESPGRSAGLLRGPFIERTLESKIEHGEQNSHLTASPEMIRDVIARFERTDPKTRSSGCRSGSSSVRYFMRQIAESAFPNLMFLSHNEVPPEVRVINLGSVQ